MHDECVSVLWRRAHEGGVYDMHDECVSVLWRRAHANSSGHGVTAAVMAAGPVAWALGLHAGALGLQEGPVVATGRGLPLDERGLRAMWPRPVDSPQLLRDNKGHGVVTL